MASKPRIVRPGESDSEPGFGSIFSLEAMTPEMREARMGTLIAWVGGWYVPHFLDYFPPEGTVPGRVVPPPLRECWPQHRSLVLLFETAKRRYDALRDGTAGSYRDEDWIAFNYEYVLPGVSYVGQRCSPSHRDLTLVRATPQATIEQPPLPGTPPPRPAAGPPRPEGWRAFLPRDEPDIEP